MKGRRTSIATTVALAALLAAPAAHAASPPKHFIALLTSTQELPASNTTATGIAYLTYKDATKELCYNITYSGLSAAESDAHIHGPNLPGEETPGNIVFGLPPGNPKSGCISPLSNAQKQALLKNLFYINIHTVAFPGGEIRGQILRVK